MKYAFDLSIIYSLSTIFTIKMLKLKSLLHAKQEVEGSWLAAFIYKDHRRRASNYIKKKFNPILFVVTARHTHTHTDKQTETHRYRRLL